MSVSHGSRGEVRYWTTAKGRGWRAFRLCFILVVTELFGASLACAQSTQDATLSPFHAGFRAGYLENYHHTTAICPTCGTYSDGKGGGYAIEFFGEVPFNFYRRLDLTFGAGLVNRGGEFGAAVSNNLTVLDPNSNKYVPLIQQSTYHASLGFVNLSAGLRVRPIKGLALYLGSNLEAGIPLGSSANYTQTAEILSPKGVFYPETHTTTREDGSGTIPNVHTSVGVSGVIGDELPLGPSFTISPEISYYYPMTNVESDFQWHVSSLRGGVAVRWNRPPPYVELPPTKPAPPPVAVREDPNAMAPKLTVVSLASEPFRIVETTVTETFPILPYVFFDSASSTLPDRFAQITTVEADRFRESELPHRSLESYYNLLNVIGSRMRSAAASHLTINGTTDGREVSTREYGEQLGVARAEAVRDYLVKVWKIEPQRLFVTTSEAPHNPSSTEYAEGLEENRRVELSSNDGQILKPIVHERFKEESSTPKSLPLQLAATSRAGVRDWRIRVRVAKNLASIYESSGNGAPPSSIEWMPTDGQIESLAKSLGTNDSLTFELEATATNGAHSKLAIALPATKTINPFELSRLSLIVFDFDQSAIGPQNKRMISQFVSKSFYDVSSATITGSTDNLGELKHNEKLSEDRAFNVRDVILAEKSNSKITSTKGIGPSNLLYDNHLPEGRYYCRTVRVEVETPLDAVVKGK